jgi:hypothetical protein
METTHVKKGITNSVPCKLRVLLACNPKNYIVNETGTWDLGFHNGEY